MIFIYLHKLVSSRPTEYDAERDVDPWTSQSKEASGFFWFRSQTGLANCPPDISLWSQVKRERANAVRHGEDTSSGARTDLQRISSWSARADSRCRPAGCHSPTACCPRLWTGPRAGTASRGLLSSGSGPEGHQRLWDTDTDAGDSTVDD